MNEYTDYELKIMFWDAQEEQDGRKIKAIREEISRRWKEQ